MATAHDVDSAVRTLAAALPARVVSLGVNVELWTNLPGVEPSDVRRMKRAEYDALSRVGAYLDERLELIRGVIVRKPKLAVANANAIMFLTQLLTLRVPDQARVRIQMPLVAPDESEPEPDVAVVPADRPREQHPAATHLVIEVSRSRLAFDRETKGPLYAAMGAPDFWIVDVHGRVVEVRREPEGERYKTLERYVPGQAIALAAFPEVSVEVAAILA